MKRLAAFCLCLALLAVCGSAWADQWGMSGEMSAFLKRSGDYDDVKYPQLSSGYKPDRAFMTFIVRKNGENTLVLLQRGENGSLQEIGRYPGALRRLPDGRSSEFWQFGEDVGFTLKNMWGNTGEEYTFAWNGTEMVLLHANNGSIIYTLREDGCGYSVDDGFETFRWMQRPLALAEFRMDLLPRTTRQAYLEKAATDDWACEVIDYGKRVTVDLKQNRNLPVYAAPSEEAFRAAKGKAAVSLSAPFDVLGVCPGGWYMVEYEISRAERRLGFVQGLDVPQAQELMLQGVMGGLARATVVTDDPHGSRRALTTLPAGAGVRVFGLLDAHWLMIECDVDGRRAMGFVPVGALQLPETYRNAEAEAELVGDWAFIGGGEVLDYGVSFHEGNTLNFFVPQEHAGVASSPLMGMGSYAWGRYDLQGKDVLVIYFEDHTACYWLDMENDAFGVTWAEGGGGYRRCTP